MVGRPSRVPSARRAAGAPRSDQPEDALAAVAAHEPDADAADAARAVVVDREPGRHPRLRGSPTRISSIVTPMATP